jgi:lipopolysaccharide transport system ATP-binding protein
MSTVITVENLGKKYTLHHQQREQYTALRDVIADGFK